MNKVAINNLLLKLKKLAIQNGDGAFGDLNEAIQTIDSLNLSLEEGFNKMDFLLLVAPTSNLHDLAIDQSWSIEFNCLATKLEKELE